MAEKILQKPLKRIFFNAAEADEMVAKGEGFLKLVAWSMRTFQRDPQRSDFSRVAFNLKHPELYEPETDVMTVEKYFKDIATRVAALSARIQ